MLDNKLNVINLTSLNLSIFVDRKEMFEIDKFMRETADRWKHVSMELRCVQSMLEEVVAYWRRWDTLSIEFNNWLEKAEPASLLPDDDRMEFFQDISIWKDKHQLLGDTASFLIATCDDQVVMDLKQHYTVMTQRWEKLFPKVKHYMHAGDILRNRKDFRKGLETLGNWLRNAESVLANPKLSSTEKITAYGEELQKLQNEVEGIEDLFKNISKTFQTLIQDLSREEVDKMMRILKTEKEALVKVRALIPTQIHLFHQLLVQQQSLESGQREINQWLDDAEQLLSCLSLDGGKDAVQAYLDKHRTFFSRTLYYKSMLESKNKVLKNIVKTVNQAGNVDMHDVNFKMQETNDRFAYVVQSAQLWEQKLQEAVRCWHNFKESERIISEWLSKAEQMISEKHIDTKDIVESHKIFFERVNERWIHDLVQSAQDLCNCLPPDQQKGIVSDVEKLQMKWKEVLSFAPLHLMRLEFRLDESTFNQYIKDIEKEINTEQQLFNKQQNIESIIVRNKEYFVDRGTILEVEHCIENMKKIADAYSKWQPQDKTLNQTVLSVEQQWENMAQKVEYLRQQLYQIPAQWQTYQEKFELMVKWMDLVDSTLKNIMKDVDSIEEFEKEKAMFQVII